MNQNQQRYAMARIEEALKVKLDAVRDKHTKPAKTASDKEKIDAIRNGDAELNCRINLRAPLQDAYDFSAVETVPVLDEAAYKKEAQALKERAAKVKDEIMLGDTKKAIQLLAKFCT